LTTNTPGLGPTIENILKNSLNSCQIFSLVKLLTNISDLVQMTFLTKIAGLGWFYQQKFSDLRNLRKKSESFKTYHFCQKGQKNYLADI
jgi:hypothetical protein